MNQQTSASTTTVRSSSSYERHEVHHHEVHHADSINMAPPPPSTPSRFQFACDTRAPSELTKMRQEAQKRRGVFQQHISDIQKQSALLTARLTNETIDRELHYEEVLQKSIQEPIEAATKRVVERLEEKFPRSRLLGNGVTGNDTDDNESDGCDKNQDREEEKKSEGKEEDEGTTTKRKPSLMELERKIHGVDKAMTKYIHETAYQTRVDHLDKKIDLIQTEINPDLKLEASKADQREGALIRKYVSLAGKADRWHAEEKAARVADLELVSDEKDGRAKENTSKDLEGILGEIRALRQLLDDERSARQSADEEIMTHIIETRKAWQQIVLDSLGD